MERNFWPPADFENEFGRAVQDFIESITLSDEELAVSLAMPDRTR
jgi:hypothetical protein